MVHTPQPPQQARFQRKKPGLWHALPLRITLRADAFACLPVRHLPFRLARAHLPARGSLRVSDTTQPQPAIAPPVQPPRPPRALWRILRQIGRSLYLILVQTLVGLIALVLLIYMTLNSPSSAALVGRILSDVLPGTFEVQALQWGPSPGRIRLRGVQIAEPSGRPVIRLGSADIKLDWLRLMDALVRRLPEIPLRFERVVLWKPDVTMETDRFGRLLLPMAFADPDKPPTNEPGPRLRVDVAQVIAQDGRFRMNLPAIALKVTGAKFRGAAQIHVPAHGSPTVAWQVQDVSVLEADVAPSAIAQLPRIPTGAAQVHVAEGDLTEVMVRGVAIQLPAMRHWYELDLPDTVVQDLDLAIALTPEVLVQAHDADIVSSTRSPFLAKLLGPKFDCEAQLQGSFQVHPVLGFSLLAKTQGRGLIAGFETDRVSAEVEVHASVPGQSMVTVDGRELRIDAYGGVVESPHIRYHMLTSLPPPCLGLPGDDACDPPEYLGEPEHVVDGHLQFFQLKPGDLLRSEAVALEGDFVQKLSGRLDGEVDAGVRVRLDPALNCEMPMTLDIALDNAWTISQEPTPTVLLPQPKNLPHHEPLPTVHVNGHVGFTADDECAKSLVLKNFLVHDRGGPHATVPQIEHLEGDWLRADGYVHLGDDDSDLRVDAEIPSLTRLLLPLGVDGVTGSLTVTNAQVRGGTVNPHAGGKISGRNLGYHGVLSHRPFALTLDHLDAGVRLAGRTVFLDDLNTCGPITGCIRGNASLQLGGEKGTPEALEQRLKLDHLQVKSLLLGELLKQVAPTVTGVDGTLGLTNTEVSVDLVRPLATLQLRGLVSLQNLQAAGQSFPQVNAKISTHSGQMHVDPLDIQLVTGEWAHAQVDADVGFHHFDVGLQLPQTPLVRLTPALAKLPLGGSVGGDIHISSAHGKLAIKTKLQVTELTWDKIQLLDAELNIDKTLDGPAVLTSPRFFQGIRLLPGSEAHFVGMKPTDFVLHVDTPDALDVFATLGMPPPTGMIARLETDVLATIDLRPGQPLYSVTASIPPRGLLLDLGGGTPGLANTSPATVTVSPGKVELQSVYFDMGREPLELCGEVDLPTADKPLALHAFLAGTIDVPRVGPLADSLASMDLELDILPLRTDPKDDRAGCLDSVQAGRGFVRLAGPMDQLTVEGRVRTRAGQVTPRHFGHDVLIEEGGEIELGRALDSSGQLIPGGMDITLASSPDQRLSGAIEDGHFDAYGTARLINLAFDSIDFTLNGTNIPFAVPKEYTISLSPQLTFTGSRLRIPARRKMLLAGQVDIPDGAYTRNFDRISGVVGNVADRHVEQFSKPITETMPWINEIELDLRVNAQNIEVQSRLPLGQVDVMVETEGLSVSGTLPKLNLVGRARVASGSESKITYSYNHLDFDVDHLSLDFQGDPTKPYIDAELRTPITVAAKSTTSSSTSAIGADLNTDNQTTSDIILVSVGYSGILTADAKAEDLRFSDNKGDSPADVQCLLLFNRRCSDTASGSGAPPISSSALLGNLSTSILKPFQSLLGIDQLLDTFVPELTADGSVGVTASKKFGRQMSFSTRVLTGTLQRSYNVNFNFRATDRLSAGGLWKQTIAIQDTGTSAPSIEVYEFKLRYKQPLE